MLQGLPHAQHLLCAVLLHAGLLGPLARRVRSQQQQAATESNLPGS
jgi:hypothetical protein